MAFSADIEKGNEVGWIEIKICVLLLFKREIEHLDYSTGCPIFIPYPWYFGFGSVMNKI